VFKKNHPDASIISATRNDTVKKTNSEDGWREISYDDYLRIHGEDEGFIASQRGIVEREGRTAFLYTPTFKQDDEL
jgi:hypothetical protein